MQVESSVCDPFPMHDRTTDRGGTEHQTAMRMPHSPSNSGLDLTGASISSVTGEDGKPCMTLRCSTGLSAVDLKQLLAVRPPN